MIAVDGPDHVDGVAHIGIAGAQFRLDGGDLAIALRYSRSCLFAFVRDLFKRTAIPV